MDNLLFLVALTVIIISIIYWFSIRNHNYWKNQKIPYLPGSKPFFGHMLSVITLRESPVTFASKAYKSTSASMIGFYHMNKPGLVLRDPDLIKSVVQTNFSNFRNNVVAFNEETDPVMAKSPFLTDNFDLWREKRTHLLNHFTAKKIKYLMIIVQEVCSKMCDFVGRKIEENGEFYECELKAFFIRYTGETVAHAAFRFEGESFKDDPDKMSFTKIIENVMKSNFANDIKKTLMVFTPGIAKFLRLKYLPDYTDAYFRENLKANLIRAKQEKVTPNDYLQFSLESNSEEDIDSIMSDIVNFCIDVYATTSSTLAHLFYHLSVNPEVETKLRQHLVSKLGDSPMTYDNLKELNYLDRVINESLRISAPMGILMRRCTEEITLTGSDGLKCQVKPGFPIFIPIINLQQDRKYWSEPEKFNPDRFSPENQALINKYTFMPFGEGPRMCIGMRLGLLVTKMASVSLIMKYSLERSSRTRVPLEIEPAAIMMYYKGGVWAKFKKLQK